jgi:toxin FitB
VNGFLLDTNLVSELVKPHPEVKVQKWVDSTDENLLYLSVLTLGEIRKGIAVLPNTPRRIALESWLKNDLVLRFSGRILPVDQEVADHWGWITAKAVTAKSLLPVIDGLLAATALHHNLTFVTRNIKDVAASGVAIFNPWIS